MLGCVAALNNLRIIAKNEASWSQVLNAWAGFDSEIGHDNAHYAVLDFGHQGER